MSKTTMTVTSNSKYTDDKSVFIDIYEKLKNIPKDETNSDRVCVCDAPKSLGSFKADPFIPQLVGLGPYHHFNVDLMMTEEFKLGAAKRVLKLKDNMDLQNSVLDIQPFYHADVHSRYPCHNLLYMLSVDGLFLLAVLHTGVKDKGPKSQQTYFLTGKPGMSLVNAAGLELTMDGIFVDLFIINNQIPSQVLKHINRVNMVDSIDLGSAMRTFCEALSPLVHFNNLPKRPEDHDHLLDLMYRLIADPEPEPEVEVPEPEPTSEPKPLSLLEKLTGIFAVAPFLIVLSIAFYAILIPLLLMQISLWLIMFLFHKVFPSVPSPSLSKESFYTIINTAFVLSLSYLVILEDILLKRYTSGYFRDQERIIFESIKSFISCDVMIPTATELYVPYFHYFISMVPAKTADNFNCLLSNWMSTLKSS